MTELMDDHVRKNEDEDEQVNEWMTEIINLHVNRLDWGNCIN